MPKPPHWELMIVWYFFLGGIAELLRRTPV